MIIKPNNFNFFQQGWLNAAAKAYAGKSRFDFGKIYARIIRTPIGKGINLSIVDMRAFNKGYTSESIYYYKVPLDYKQ